MKKFIIIDGAGLIYRAFFAIPAGFASPSGEPTNAVYGFTSMLINILSRHQPDYIAVAHDRKEKTFRHEEYKEYKATRVAAPDTLYAQIPRVKELATAFSISQFEKAGYEADDLIATMIDRVSADTEVLVATADFDIFQTVNDHVRILYPEKGYREAVFFGVEEIKKKYGLSPTQIPDYKGLCGDTSDNLKGVPGIGKKTAQKLLAEYGSVENIYAHIGDISGATKTKLENGKEDAFFCKRLATLDYKVPFDFSLSDCAFRDFDMTKLLEIFTQLGFDSLRKRLPSLSVKHIALSPQSISEQASLF
ncbi:MAG: 5'-3' exonuclease H3TH domain-containing protein [Patescibacteria group bacterium]|mgnify:CR=1 FL=1